MKTQKTIITLLFLFITSSVFAQKDIEKEVNETLWKTFVESWKANDHKVFNSIHTDDVLRVNAWEIKVGEEYKKSNTANMQKGSGGTAERNIQFWFEHRVYSGNMGYEVGYYKISVKVPNQEEQNYYARFHVVLRKESGQWKIAQDWDTNDINGHKVSEADWAKGKALIF